MNIPETWIELVDWLVARNLQPLLVTGHGADAVNIIVIRLHPSIIDMVAKDRVLTHVSFLMKDLIKNPNQFDAMAMELAKELKKLNLGMDSWKKSDLK